MPVTGLGTWAGLITAFATLLTAAGGFVLAVKVLMPTKREVRETKAQVEQVHTLVNQANTDLKRYIGALTSELTKQGISVPIDQSTYDNPIPPRDKP